MTTYRNFPEKLDLLKTGALLLEDNVNLFLNRINEHRHLNAFLAVFAEEALQQAALVQQKINSGSAGKLAGMVVAIKDVLAIEAKPLTCASRILKNFTSLYSATCVKRLLDEDAIIIGKTNCDEFAMGSSNENSAFGPVLNPIDNERVPGGSSGGSAAAVAAGLCDAALGTDTGGSIRQPAAFCGIYGLKPTYSRVSRYGLTAFASSFDTIGPFTNSPEDAAAIMEVIAGFDSNDATSSMHPVPKYSDFLNTSSKLTIGVPAEYIGQGLQPEIKAEIEEVIGLLRANGHIIKSISLPASKYSIAVYYILTMAEASSNLARFDGGRYGMRSEAAGSLQEMYELTRSECLGAEVKRRIMLGTYVLSAGYYDAYYKKAQQVRRLIKQDFDKAFAEVDIILTPTTPTTAFKIGEKSDDPLEMYLGDIYTTSANLAGIPGINFPAGKAENGMPIGLQLMAKEFNEAVMFECVNAIRC